MFEDVKGAALLALADGRFLARAAEAASALLPGCARGVRGLVGARHGDVNRRLTWLTTPVLIERGYRVHLLEAHRQQDGRAAPRRAAHPLHR